MEKINSAINQSKPKWTSHPTNRPIRLQWDIRLIYRIILQYVQA